MTHQPLAGERIVVGVTAGIAAYKAAHIVRGLAAWGADVRVIPTPSSLEFVGAATWEALTGHRVLTSVFEDVDQVAHVATGQDADAILIAPATADFLARARMGRADDLMTASLLVARGPVIMAPAMHTEMWEHPATRDNVTVLRERGIDVMEPAVGRLTGPDSGPGRLPEPEQILHRVLATLRAPRAAAPTGSARAAAAGAPLRDLAGRRVLITAGGTHEAIDPVRFISNHSSGKQGVALAHAAAARGADVTLILAGAVTEPLPTGIAVERVDSAAELAEAVHRHEADHDAVVMAAAVSDFAPTGGGAGSKLKKTSPKAGLTLQMEQTEDILRSLVTNRERAGSGPTVIVGFAAETGDEHATALDHARDKARRKGADLLAFNNVAEHAFGSADNAVVLLDGSGSEIDRADGTKTDVAHAILTAIARLLTPSGGASDPERKGRRE
ncbi:bifunctional phosphopantothenoylcysteine decarboxylase/phosphopantothenate--cysteine ligase CoaBC [Helcobacillus massiliensis]|uniref:Coenzyme A biosynthesis bifunctional protein CoaBC n=1 Tax=Helcobacillus massiliensis TaxID=521392 RepID=A0A839QPB0_9MICO|nr:bifunctional phosphopantothenoylcysteine decarboxylase/phosphopantothenate--cysteine ligase CoaBC [Helcobacillus massiliensis]MBB3022333.1 phosphopantothenoylcysteine decarboxylase/phosphopantothenate--cysteine ligase [Helcobacillus massiliensis]